MEFISLDELSDIDRTKDVNRYNLKALWNNFNLAIHGVKSEIDSGVIVIDGEQYDLFSPAPVLQPKSEHYDVIIYFVGGYASTLEYQFSQTLNRDQSRRLTHDAYKRVRVDLKRSKGCHTYTRLMDGIRSEIGGRWVGADELVDVLRRRLTTSIEGHRISIERGRSKQRIRTYVYICIDDKRVTRFKGGWTFNKQPPTWGIEDVSDAVTALINRIYK